MGAQFVEKAHFLAGFVMLWLQAAVNIVDVFFVSFTLASILTR